jgi:nickel-dependent lactate racemase
MDLTFTYDWVEPLTVPDANLVGVFAPRTDPAGRDAAAVIAAGLAAPIGSDRLRVAARGARRILILADDVSRPTPVDRILPSILAELAAAGAGNDQIEILMALGTHRAMTAAEIDAKLGPGIRHRFAVHNHAWDDRTAHVDLGTTAQGTPIRVNRRLVEADFVIGIGNIVPHPAAGFSGGGKIVDPGCVDGDTCGAFHWESVRYPAREVVGRRDQPMMAMIDEVAARAGLRYIANTVLDARGGIVRLVCGHPVLAHRAGCETAVAVYGVRIPEPADIVVCDSHPADLEMWQAIKGLCNADLCLKDGGTVIMATPCPEGASAEHPELERYGYRPFADTAQLIAAGAVNHVVGHHLVQGGRLLARARRVLIVSPHLTDAVVRRLGFEPAPTMSHAFAAALAHHGPAARVTCLCHAAELFPVVG